MIPFMDWRRIFIPKAMLVLGVFQRALEYGMVGQNTGLYQLKLHHLVVLSNQVLGERVQNTVLKSILPPNIGVWISTNKP